MSEEKFLAVYHEGNFFLQLLFDESKDLVHSLCTDASSHYSEKMLGQ
jgi:hypothetical protein